MKLVPLESVARVNYGTRVTRKKDAGSTYPVYGGGGETFRLDTFNRENCTIVSRFAMSEECVRYVSGKFFLNDSGLSVETLGPSLDQRYLDLFLFSKAREIYAMGRGTAQKNLDVDTFRKMPLPLPSLEEQLAIVSDIEAALDEATKYSQIVESQSKGDAELFNSFLEAEFTQIGSTFDLVAAADLLDVRDGTHDSPKFVSSGYPFITSKNLKNGQLDFQNVKYISESDFLEFNKRSKVDKGDLLFGMIGTIGNPVVVTDTQPFAIKNVALIKNHPNYDLDFLRYFYLSPSVKKRIEDGTKGTTQKFVGLGNLRRFKIPNVPIEVQRASIERIRAVESHSALLGEVDNRLRETISEFRTALLSSYFGREKAFLNAE